MSLLYTLISTSVKSIFQMSHAKSIDIAELKGIIQSQASSPSSKVVIVDVRSADEFNDGHVPNAFNIPIGNFETALKQILAQQSSDAGTDSPVSGVLPSKFPKPNDPSSCLLLYCKSGGRTRMAQGVAENLGYQNNLMVYYPGWNEFGSNL
ncbi:Thiosulfate sulfurtransferase rdl2, mitochondrial [Mycoemilia scoparia]|uniref:Thiosulfate sulfurtransferase rdl2, mitochondrial n=1 Tax=Mycoemilia scoparia TaxID=417184 RepID=A0A9W8A0S0_9FUNG|nr:Thiosulfate sulfurtransferase rdl2, mitochondrial [Mycoemilia scoparia]